MAYEIEKLYIQLDYVLKQGHADTADLDELIEIAKDRGIYQKATNAYANPVKGKHGDTDRDKVFAQIPLIIGS